MQIYFGQHSYGEPNVITRAFAYAKFFSCSHGAVIRVYYVTLSAARSLVGRSYHRQRGDRMAAKYDSSGMRKTIYLLAMLGLFAACEQKTTTVNPPAEKKETNTTIVNPPSEKKETKTDINVNTSTSPNP